MSYYLKPIHDSRDSFYNKAEVMDENMPSLIGLKSYNTLVAEIEHGKVKVYGYYSQTTMRHIKEFLKQNGFKVEDTKQVLKDYGVNSK